MVKSEENVKICLVLDFKCLVKSLLFYRKISNLLYLRKNNMENNIIDHSEPIIFSLTWHCKCLYFADEPHSLKMRSLILILFQIINQRISMFIKRDFYMKMSCGSLIPLEATFDALGVSKLGQPWCRVDFR